MDRSNPNYKQQTSASEEDLAFLDELFDSLFDNDAISSDTDKVPNLAAFHDAT